MSEWRIEGLGARRPQPDLRDELMLFGQFVGEWDIVERRLGEHNASHTERTGEVHFNWILDGRGVQDVWGPVDRPSGRFVPVGTTIRFYDARLGA